MAKVIIRKSGATIEAELSVAELKELAGLNGHTSRDHGGRETGQAPLPLDSNYKAFFNALSEQGKRFLHFVKAAGPKGIAAENVAKELGFENRYALGGVAGGSLGKQAKNFGIDLGDVYVKEAPSENGVKTVIFKPGKILEFLE
jgi:hypothetical protein